MKEIQNEFNNDFGFFAVGENEIVERENVAAKKAVETVKSKNNKEVQKYKDKLKELHDLIMPFLKNLQNNSEKSYIYWPDRQGKIEEFILKVKKIALDYEPL
jgi:hypothetical protein